MHRNDLSKEKGWDATMKALSGDQFAEILGSTTEVWQNRNGKFFKMLKLNEETFGMKRGQLLDLIDERVEARKKQLQETQDPTEEAT